MNPCAEDSGLGRHALEHVRVEVDAAQGQPGRKLAGMHLQPVWQAAGMRADRVAVDHPDLTVGRVGILVVEIQGARDTGKGGRQDRDKDEELEEPASHLDPPVEKQAPPPADGRKVPEPPEELPSPAMNEPARWGLRRRMLNLLDRLHLARPTVHLYEYALAARARLTSREPATAPDGLPLPPASLRAQVGPRHADAAFFLESGEQHAALVRGLLEETGTSVEDLGALLDWGCGCGRVLRHWRGLPRTQVYGCDINPKMVEWCAINLDFAHVDVTELAPPLPYPDSTFDLIYAFSVFTHLGEDLQHEWIRECRRVLTPGGCLLISTMGEYYLGLQRLTEEERTAFANGELVVLYEHSAGTSLCSAYHPPAYVRGKLASEFDVVAFKPAADEGRHDIHLLRKPAEVAATAEHA